MRDMATIWPPAACVANPLSSAPLASESCRSRRRMISQQLRHAAAPAAPVAQRPQSYHRHVARSSSASSASSPPAAEAVWMAPSSSLATTEACVKLLAQAYINHPWRRELGVQPGKEAQLFAGLARCVLDVFAEAPVLLTTSPHAAAVVLSGEQEAQLVAALQGLDFAVIPGTLHVLQAIPEGRLPKLTALLTDLQRHTAAHAAEQAASAGYRKLLCLGVAPGSQGRGVGGELLAAAVAAATQARVPLYADAADDVAVGMLQRRGFSVVGGSTAHCAQLVLSPL